ncbi:Rubber elongation factor [Macleaya cordata]|uniref:Rubber elongation factor n=1 Tax=Macleaya cordata TaxID=56857 RepID=A0A200QGI4_MACCD|nr:Rubber elongation factor [Macleaya cordata]
MATNNVERTEDKNEELKYLGFVKIAAINALICLSNLYEYAKQNSGPLRSGLRTVEGTVTTAIRPVFEKFKNVPNHLLVFFDHKLDEATHKLDQHAPPVAKQVASQSWLLVQKASQLTQALVSETRTRGVPAAVSYAINKSEQYLLEQAVKTWFTLNQVTPFHMVAEMAVPTAAHWSDKYNQLVINMTKKGYFGFSYLPLVPVDKIAKAFKTGEAREEEVKPSSES